MVREGYKQTEIGEIPVDWEFLKIEELGDVVRGGSPRPAGDPKYFNGHYIPWLTVASLTKLPVQKLIVSETEGNLTEAGANHSRRLETGTVIIANSGATLGVAKILGITCCANDGIAALINPKKGNSEFFCHFFNTITNKLRDVVATGNGQPNLNTTLIKNIRIPFPPEREQQAIAQALSDVDSLIDGLEKLIAKKRDIKTATMQQLLTGKTRLPGFGEGKGYKQTELGDIPEDWEVLSLGGQIIDLRGGASFRPNDFTQDGVLVLPKVGVVRGGVLKLEEKDVQYCSHEKAKTLTKCFARRTDIVVVLRDLVPSGPSIGLMVRIPSKDKYILAQGVYAFQVKDRVSADYLIQYSNTVQYRRMMNETGVSEMIRPRPVISSNIAQLRNPAP